MTTRVLPGSRFAQVFRLSTTEDAMYTRKAQRKRANAQQLPSVLPHHQQWKLAVQRRQQRKPMLFAPIEGIGAPIKRSAKRGPAYIMQAQAQDQAEDQAPTEADQPSMAVKEYPGTAHQFSKCLVGLGSAVKLWFAMQRSDAHYRQHLKLTPWLVYRDFHRSRRDLLLTLSWLGANCALAFQLSPFWLSLILFYPGLWNLMGYRPQWMPSFGAPVYRPLRPSERISAVPSQHLLAVAQLLQTRVESALQNINRQSTTVSTIQQLQDLQRLMQRLQVAPQASRPNWVELFKEIYTVSDRCVDAYRRECNYQTMTKAERKLVHKAMGVSGGLLTAAFPVARTYRHLSRWMCEDMHMNRKDDAPDDVDPADIIQVMHIKTGMPRTFLEQCSEKKLEAIANAYLNMSNRRWAAVHAYEQLASQETQQEAEASVRAFHETSGMTTSFWDSDVLMPFLVARSLTALAMHARPMEGESTRGSGSGNAKQESQGEATV